MPKNKYPEQIQKALEAKGFFNLDVDTRIRLHKKAFNAILKSSKGDPDAEKRALKELRGGRK